MNEPNDLVCFSHLRWNFVFQRPNHLMERCSRERRVFFVEEPVFDAAQPGIGVDHIEDLFVVVPRLPRDTATKEVPSLLAECYAQLFRQFEIKHAIAWYYTPMSLLATRDFQFSMVVYDCMDQLSAFYGAPPELVSLERELLSIARLVFTGGHSLYEEKRYQHQNVHAFPSSVDASHFGRARQALPEPGDQGHIPHPRLGFYGVIDERMDLDLLAHVARERPSWQLVLIGPVVKIDPSVLPQAPNLHYLGMEEYRQPYADEGLVRCARGEGFVAAVEAALAEGFAPIQSRVDELLVRTSWDRTWAEMSALLNQHLPARPEPVKAAG